MIRSGAIIYSDSNYQYGIPYIYINNEWVPTNIHSWQSNNWELVGAAGTPMIKFITADNKELKDSNGLYFLVRKE